MKKLLCAVLAICLFALAGCGFQKGDIQIDIEYATQPDHESIPEQEPTEAEETITFVSSGGEVFTVTVNRSEGTCRIDECRSGKSEISVPEEISGCTVVGIGPNAFSQNLAKKITLPDTVLYIDAYAFNTCDNLEEVYLGTSLEWVGTYLFSNCPVLKSVTFPETLTHSKGIIFACCFGLETAYIPASLTEIDMPISTRDLCPKLVIVTPAGSAAETSAIENGLPVRSE